MARGVPIVATDCGGPAAMLAENTGILTPISAEGIAEGISCALQDIENTRAMGLAGHARALQEYARPVQSQRLDAIVREVRERPGPILNIMLGRLRGGLEQAAVDYAEALQHAPISAVTVLSPDAYILPAIATLKTPHFLLPHAGWWDILASHRLRRIARRRRVRAAISHGGRALTIARRALPPTIPIIGVTHSEHTRYFPKADACFCITTHARERFLSEGIPHDKLFMVPNMTRLPAAVHEAMHTPPVIGTLGRHITRKGFHDWLEALAILKQRGIAFKALLGGDGEEHLALRQSAQRLNLANEVTFLGWVEQNQAFYPQLDIFVMPSHFEPFGLVLIEAMGYGLPVVTTAVDGPRDITTHEQDALMVPPQQPAAMAEALERLLQDPVLAAQLGRAARQRVENEYSKDAMARRLKQALDTITSTS
jgi:glycosyltransferase involved in cell wall biosynthesis